MENVIFIRYQYPYDSNLIGREEFNEDLRKCGVVQDRVLSTEHCYELFELWDFQILINHPLVSFIAETIAGEIVLEIIKKLLGNAFDALKKFQDKNKDFQISEMEFNFDDVSIVLFQPVASDYHHLCNFFIKLEGMVRLLKSNDIDNIYKISYPYQEAFDRDCDVVDEPFIETFSPEEIKDSYVKIDYCDGFETIYYQPSTGVIRDRMGKIEKQIAEYDI